MEENKKNEVTEVKVKGMGFVKGALVAVVGLKAVDLFIKLKVIGQVSEHVTPIMKGVKAMFGSSDEEKKD